MAGYSVTFTVIDNASKAMEAINARLEGNRRRIEQAERGMERTLQPVRRAQQEMAKFGQGTGLSNLTKGFGELEQSSYKAFGSIARIIPGMSVITGAATLAGMAKLAADTAKWAENLDKVADSTGVSRQRIDQLRTAWELTGGAAEEMDAVLKGVTDTMAGMVTGATGGETRAWMARLGIGFRDVADGTVDAGVGLERMLEAINQLPNASDRSRAALALGGSQLEKMANAFRASGKSITEWMNEARQLGGFLTGPQMEALNRYDDALDKLNVTFVRLGRQIGATMADAFEPMVTQFQQFVVQSQPEIKQAFDDFGTSIRTWGETDFPKALEGLKEFIGYLKQVEAVLNAIDQAAQRAGQATAWMFRAPSRAFDWLADKLGLPGSRQPTVIQSPFGPTSLGTGPTSPGTYTGFPGQGVEAPLPAVPAPSAAPAAPPAAPAPLPAAPAQPPATYRGRAGEGVEAPLPPPPPAAPAPAATPQRFGWTSGFTGQATPASLTMPATGLPAAPAGLPAEPAPAPTTGGNRGSLYEQRAGRIVNELMTSFDLTRDQAAGLVGNLGYESGGFKSLQEIAPIGGKNARGGYGYAQWTGPRRRQFEAWSAQQGLDPSSHEANVGFLKHELSTTQAPFLERLKRTPSIEAASRLTHTEFERPMDVINGTYRSAGGRLRYARQAAQLAGTAAAPQQQRIPWLGSYGAAGPPADPSVAPPPGAAGANGQVDVTVTHRNPPPGTTIRANGQGDVKVKPLRVEQQELESV